MSSVSGKVEESKGQDRKDEHKKRRAEGEPSWYERAVDANFEEEELDIPKNKVGLVIGKRGWKREDIIARSGIRDLFIKEDLVYIRGTEEQRTSAKQIIEKVLRVSFAFIFTPFYVIINVLFVLISFKPLKNVCKTKFTLVYTDDFSSQRTC